MILLHYTGMRDGASALDRLCDAAAEVSCHYVVAEDGRLMQLVDEERRAWHAGRGVWAGASDINSLSIGVEIVNGGHEFGLPDFPAPQIAAVVDLCLDVAKRWRIRPERVLAHSDVAPGRKRDPGERFPWRRLAAAGVGLWVDVAPEDTGPGLQAGDAGPAVRELQESLARYGYGLEPTAIYDLQTEMVVQAFQRHFRPEAVTGRADPHTTGVLVGLLDAVAKVSA